MKMEMDKQNTYCIKERAERRAKKIAACVFVCIIAAHMNNIQYLERKKFFFALFLFYSFRFCLSRYKNVHTEHRVRENDVIFRKYHHGT